MSCISHDIDSIFNSLSYSTSVASTTLCIHDEHHQLYLIQMTVVPTIEDIFPDSDLGYNPEDYSDIDSTEERAL